ncbi:tetratricopeptide repeat protein [Nostoc sp.]|uniref:tetratricopeptide repeat protein n=1 Tax=Nostoc sp. TaxID=1180 RepID=UPI002FF4640C
MVEPVTTLALLGAIAPIAQSFIAIVPDLIQVISERNRASKQLPNSNIDEERQNIQQELQELRQSLQQEQIKQQDQLEIGSQEAQRELFKQQKQMEQQLAIYNRQTQLKIADYQRQTALQLPEVQKIFDNWPLTIVPSQILNERRDNSLIPIRIFLSPPKLSKVLFKKDGDFSEGFPEIKLKLEQGLSEFLDKYYPLQDKLRPTEFLGGAWDSNRARREASIKALFGMLKSEPSLILESEIINNEIVLRFGYWGIGQDNYSYQSISKLPYREIMYDFAKGRALKWKEDRTKLLNLGRTLEEISKIGGEKDFNLNILEEEENLKNNGIETKDLPIHHSYKVNNEDFEDFCQILVICHCLVAGWIIDAHYLIHYDVPPLLPKLLSELLTDDIHNPQVLQPLLQGIVTGYRMLYASLLNERPSWMPELSLDLAKSLISLPEKSWAREQIYFSVKSWLKLHQESSQEGIDALKEMKSFLTVGDSKYFEAIKDCFNLIGDSKEKQEILNIDWAMSRKKKESEAYYRKGIEKGEKKRYVEAIAEFSQAIYLNPYFTECYFSRGFTHTQMGNHTEAIKDYTQVIHFNPNVSDAYVNRGNAHYRMGDYEAAIRDYDSALQLNPAITEVSKYRNLAINQITVEKMQ